MQERKLTNMSIPSKVYPKYCTPGVPPRSLLSKIMVEETNIRETRRNICTKKQDRLDYLLQGTIVGILPVLVAIEYISLNYFPSN